jgi:hypothetical protein
MCEQSVRAVLGLQQKLRLDLVPEEAEVAFQELIDIRCVAMSVHEATHAVLSHSVFAVIPVAVEAFHRFMQGIRS